MSARIYRPAKTAMSSGTAKTQKWVLEFVAQKPRTKDTLTGWNSAAETQTQVRLKFDTLEAAQQYARQNGLAVRVDHPHERQHTPKSYSDNFRHDRRSAWTH